MSANSRRNLLPALGAGKHLQTAHLIMREALGVTPPLPKLTPTAQALREALRASRRQAH